jgi:hypothetical protein
VLRYSGLCDPASAAWLLCAAVFFDCFSSCLMLWPAGASPPESLQNKTPAQNSNLLAPRTKSNVVVCNALTVTLKYIPRL